MRKQFSALSTTSNSEQRLIRGLILRYRKNEQMRIVIENEVVLFISKSYKMSLAWQRQHFAKLRVYLNVCFDVLPKIQGSDSLYEPIEVSDQQAGTCAINNMLGEHFKRMGSPTKIQFLERSLSNRTSNYQVCSLINALVDTSRSEFNRLSRKILDIILVNLEQVEMSQTWRQNPKPAVISIVRNQKTMVTPQQSKYRPIRMETKNPVQQFVIHFSTELKNYCKTVADCLLDIDFRFCKLGKQKYIRKQPKEEWLNLKLDNLVEARIASYNQPAQTTIASYVERYRQYKDKEISKFRMKTRNSYRKKILEKTISCVSSKNLTSPQSNCGIRKTIALPLTRLQNVLRPQTEKSDLPISKRLEFKINKSHLQLNYEIPTKDCQRKIINSNTRSGAKQVIIMESVMNKNNRISGLLKKSMLQYPQYIQVLKDIINL